MEYIPGAASLAATHRGSVKNLRLSTLRDSQQNVDPRSSILDFEKETVAHDRAMKGKVEGTCVHTHTCTCDCQLSDTIYSL